MLKNFHNDIIININAVTNGDCDIENMKIAPILITVYNRYEHFLKCIESLKKCEYSDKSDLYIAIDAPYRDEDVVLNKKIITYAEQIKGFNKLIVYIRENNIGSSGNFIQAISDVFSVNDRLIFFEDDNIFSPNFLNFINKGLEVYKDRNDIFSISGYNYPVKMPKNYLYDYYIWSGFTAWGVGVWKDKWLNVNFNKTEVDLILQDKIIYEKITNIAPHVSKNLEPLSKNWKLLGDLMITLHIINNSMYSIFPTISRVRNTGHDGSGEHGGKNSTPKFHNQPIYEGNESTIFIHDIKPDDSIYKVLYQYSLKHSKIGLKGHVIKIFKFLGLHDFVRARMISLGLISK